MLSLLLLSLALGFGPRQTRAQGWEGPLEGAVVFCLKPAQAAAIRRSSCEKQRSASMRHTKDQQKLRTKAGKNVLPYRHCMTMFPLIRRVLHCPNSEPSVSERSNTAADASLGRAVENRQVVSNFLNS